MRAVGVVLALWLWAPAGSAAEGKGSERGQGSTVTEGWRLAWSPKLATAQSKDRRTNLVIFKQEYRYSDDPTSVHGTEPCGSADGRLISVVGTVVSYQFHAESTCGATPGGTTELRAVQLSEGLPPALITDLFEERDVVLALQQATPVADGLGPITFQDRPRSLAALVEMLDSKVWGVSFSELASAFAVLDAGERVAVVRFGVSARYGHTVEFDVVIPITKHREWFTRAKKNRTLWMAETDSPPWTAIDDEPW